MDTLLTFFFLVPISLFFLRLCTAGTWRIYDIATLLACFLSSFSYLYQAALPSNHLFILHLAGGLLWIGLGIGYWRFLRTGLPLTQ